MKRANIMDWQRRYRAQPVVDTALRKDKKDVNMDS